MNSSSRVGSIRAKVAFAFRTEPSMLPRTSLSKVILSCSSPNLEFVLNEFGKPLIHGGKRHIGLRGNVLAAPRICAKFEIKKTGLSLVFEGRNMILRGVVGPWDRRHEALHRFGFNP